LSLGSFGAVVLFVHDEKVSPPALRALDDFVAAGGGLLAIHAASASYVDEAQWLRILSGRFREHGPVQTFRVEPALEEDEVFGGIPAFSVRDELYRHDYDPHVRFHFATRVDGEQEPVVWTKYWGVGRVCYCSLGHTLSSIRNPRVLEILRRGLDWVCATPPEADATG
jgi:type 1 glutamine amidotransferase